MCSTLTLTSGCSGGTLNVAFTSVAANCGAGVAVTGDRRGATFTFLAVVSGAHYVAGHRGATLGVATC